MNRVISILLIAGAIVSHILFYAIAQAGTNDLDIVVNAKKKVQLNKNVFGVHGEMLWSPVRYEDELLATLFNDIGFTGVRFPGGTTSNYYMWESGSFGCAKDVPADSRSVLRVKAFNNGLKNKKRSYSTDNFLSFLENSKTEFSLVLNVFCDTHESNLRWLKRLKNDGINVSTIELGNELYYKEYRWVFQNPGDYLKTANKLTMEIKKIFPNAKVGFIGSSSAFRAKHYPDIKRLNKSEHYKYGLSLDKLSSQSKLSDAIVVHLYSTPGLSKFEKFVGAVDSEKIYTNALSHFDSRRNEIVDHFSSINPDKELWVTEWGVLFYGDTLSYEKKFQSSIYNALFLMNGLLTFALTDEVNRAYYHNLPHFLPDKNGKAKASVSLLAMKVLKESLSTSDMVSFLKIKGMKTHQSTHQEFDGISEDITSVYLSGGVEDYLILINKFDTDYMIRSLKTESDINISPVHMRQIKPSGAFSSNGKNVQSGVDFVSEDIKSTSNIFLPGHSITIITTSQL